jgi:hypothetical protein
MPTEPDDPADLGADAAAANLRDTRMQERALRERWPMSPAVRVKVLKRLAKIVDDEAWGKRDQPTNREVVSAARALISADRLNLDQARLEQLTREGELTVRDVLSEAEASAEAYVPESPPPQAQAP